MIKAKRLGHVVMNVSNLDASIAFYTRVVGLEVMHRNPAGTIAFLSLGEQHHDLALVQRATGAPPEPTQPGLVHMAWQVADFPALQAAFRELSEAGVEIEPIQHNITNSLYMRDPDGHVVELFCDRFENGIEVIRTQGPRGVVLDMETGQGLGPEQEVLAARAR